MQLIFETENVADIKDNMSSLEESLDDKLISDALMDSLKHISHGNKENIQKEENIPRIEENTENNNKLEDEDSQQDGENEEDLQKSNTEKIKDEVVENSSPEDSMDAELPDTNESHSNSTDVNKVQLKTEQDESGQSDENNIIQNEQSTELEKVKQEVDDILAEKVSDLANNVQREIDNLLNSTKEESDDIPNSEETKDDTIPVESPQLILEDNDSSKVPTPSDMSPNTENSPQHDSDVIPVCDDDKIEPNKTDENESVNETKLDEAAASDVSNIDEQDNIIDDVANTCSMAEEDKPTSECIETVTIQDENDDIVDTTVVEPMDVDEVCEEKTSITDKEDNEITLLDSPVNADIKKSEEDDISSNTLVDNDKTTELNNKGAPQDATFIASNDKVMIVDKSKENSQKLVEQNQKTPPQQQIEKEPEKATSPMPPVVCRLSNNLNILSDDEDEPPKETPKEPTPEKQCINLEDDDDIMLIDEDTTNKKESSTCEPLPTQNATETDLETGESTNKLNSVPEAKSCDIEEPTTSTAIPSIETEEKQAVQEETSKTVDTEKPLLPDNFLKLSRKNIADMTRNDLEEFCILKIVESIVDRSNLSEIKSKLKVMAQSLEEFKKKAMMLTKQNKDLEVVLRSVQDEQSRASGTAVIPMKITRSVGMQVYMTDKFIRKKSVGSGPQQQQQQQQTQQQQPAVQNTKVTRSSVNQVPRPNKPPGSPNIPVPRLIPANNAAIRGPTPQNIQNNAGKPATSPINGIRTPATPQKNPEKRPLNKSQSVTVDLTDDEPPSKMPFRSPAPPVRLVPAQNLLAPQRPQFGQAVNGPRKVYIPISGPQGQQIKPGQTIMLKTSPTGPPRQRAISPNIARLATNQVRMNKVAAVPRHPAPLPDAVKQYQPPNWKALPPAPDLKLSKVENGIVISWKIDGYQEDSYEEIASYQLYAYQETQSPPSTSLWKKIGDVKALPLPMACTLTQFMAGFKYYFAVRAVDVKSRLGPFSIPGSILLLSKM